MHATSLRSSAVQALKGSGRLLDASQAPPPQPTALCRCMLAAALGSTQHSRAKATSRGQCFDEDMMAKTARKVYMMCICIIQHDLS